MYRILITKPNMPKDNWKFYEQTVSTIDPETGEATKTTSIYEAETLAELAETYTTLLETCTSASVLPVDMLKVDLGVTITDETTD